MGPGATAPQAGGERRRIPMGPGATAAQAGGRLLERICPVEAFFIVPRSVAGGFPAAGRLFSASRRTSCCPHASRRAGGCPALPGLPAGPAITGETTSTPRASPVQLYAWIRVPERPAMASATLLSNPMTQVRPGWLSANLMAALTFGSMEPLPNCPSSR